MNYPSELVLFGFAKPYEQTPTFLVPIFGSESEMWIQDGKTEGAIERFFPCSIPRDRVIHERNVKLRAKIGDAFIYAFQFADKAIEVGPREHIQRTLSSKLNELREYPFLLIDVLRFVNKWDELPEAIRNAQRELAVDDVDIAHRWALSQKEKP